MDVQTKRRGGSLPYLWGMRKLPAGETAEKGAIPVPGLREKTEGIGAVPGRQPGNRTRANAPERLDSLWECSWDCFLEALLGGL